MSGDNERQNAAAHIPAEYQELFREAMNLELREAGEDQTDSDILAYLRQRLNEFERGDYIRPDGKPGTVALPAAELYDIAGEEIAQQGTAAAGGEQARRRLLLKMGGLALVAALLLLLIFRGQRQRSRGATDPATPTPPALAANAGRPTPTPTITAPTGADTALQTIGGLGGSLTLGRPSALTIRYQATEETVALPIDPARISSRGELPFNVEIMASDSPVAVWVFGTVLNYAVGLPPGLVQALQPGDRLQLATDTGFTLSFVVTETAQRASYETSDLLSQDRVGMTLFGLPAPAANNLPVALAGYDLSTEDRLTAVHQMVGTPFFTGSELQISEVVYSDRPDGQLAVTLQGRGQAEGAGTLAIQGRSHQTTAVQLPAEDPWQLTFILPGTVRGEPLTAVYRQMPRGESATVSLGEAPDLTTTLIVVPPEAAWQPETGRMLIMTEVTNPGPGQVCLPADYLVVPQAGNNSPPFLPAARTCLAGGETRLLRLTVAHPGPETPLVVRVGDALWGTP